MPDEKIISEPIIYPRRVLPIANVSAGLVLAVISLLSVMIYWQFILTVSYAAIRSITYVTRANSEFLAIILTFPTNVSIDASAMIVAVAFETTVALFVFAVFRNAFSIFYLALARLGLGVVQLTSSGAPEDTPIKYSNAAGVIGWMGEKKEYRSKLSSQESISVFGYGIQYISPAASEVAAPVIAKLLRTGKDGLRQSVGLVFLGWAGVVVLVTAPTWDAFREALPQVTKILVNIGAGEIVWTVGGTYAIYLLTVGCCLFLDWLFVRLLASGAKPIAEVVNKSENAQVALAPYLFGERFQQDLEQPASDGDRSRVYRSAAEGASASMSDMGNFALLGLVERKPRPVRNPNMRAALMRLWSGWALVAMGALMLTVLLLPSTTRASVDMRRLAEWKVFLDPIQILLMMITGGRALREGVRMVGDGEALLGTYWFEAPSLRYDIRGVTSKSEIRLGGANDDSIRTSSSLARSEFTARLTVGSLKAEVANLYADREIYAMRVTEECSELMQGVLGSLQNLADVRPALVGIDLSRDDVVDVINANAAARAAKATAEKLALRKVKQREALQPEAKDRLSAPSQGDIEE